MKLTRGVMIVALTGLALAACRREPPPEPEPIVRVDTVVVTREVEPPLPEGRPADVCLATGQEVQVYISPQGDTLVGPRRTRLAELRGVALAGDYASDEPWFNQDEDIRIEGRRYTKFGTEEAMDCGAIKIVDEYNGVNIFADAQATAPYDVVYVPVRPGLFQAYRTGVGRVRG